MNTENRHHTTDILDHATFALRNSPVPTAPPPQFVAATISALHSTDHTQFQVSISEPSPLVGEGRVRGTSRIVLARYGGLAAALILLIALGGMIALWNHGASPAFAQVVESIRNSTSVSFTITSKAGDQPLDKTKVFLQSDLMRLDSCFDASAKTPDWSVVVDFKNVESTEIDYSEKTFHKRNSKELNKDAMQKLGSPVGWLKDLAQNDGELIGDEVLDGRKTHVYRLTKIDYPLGIGKIETGDFNKIWVDSDSGLPVKIDVQYFDTLNNRKTHDVYENFKWNDLLDPKLFDMTVPEGFKVSNSQ